MDINKIILQLTEDDYQALKKQLEATSAHKFYTLLKAYRERESSDVELLSKLEMTHPTFYTLRSRLMDKVQDFLYKNTQDMRVELLKNVANIESWVYKAPRETAIGMLKKLEVELIKHDMPYELLSVYKALRKLHVNSQKYHDYSQLYNKHVAFTLAQDKAEELLSLFCKTQAEYFLSRDEKLLDVLILYKKEIVNICRLYESHHLKLYRNILLVNFSIFSPVKNELTEELTVEEMLQESLNIIKAHPNDRVYRHLKVLIHFLYFEYYHKLKLKDATKYFERIETNTNELLSLYNFGFVHHFLISKISYLISVNSDANLLSLGEFSVCEVGRDDVSAYIMLNCYKAAVEFYAKNYTGAIKILTDLQANVSFKNYSFADLEVKAFLILLYLFINRDQQAKVLLRSILRKISQQKNKSQYLSVFAFVKVLRMALNTLKENRYNKILVLYADYKQMNEKHFPFLHYLKLDNNRLRLITIGNTVQETEP